MKVGNGKEIQGNNRQRTKGNNKTKSKYILGRRKNKIN